ncbi:MAG TPA: ATP-binding protein [Deltaproteobacteria bacterium]|jgi:anti-sigma regulatory factor (Ser/Thr protein kinase)|nr:ATP-binding protein [Deltaproteobacteria bacterium]
MLAELSDHVMDIAMNSVRAGARNISIAIIAQRDKGTLSVSIGDDGIGMDEETLRKVSDPFYSTKAGKTVGLGVSLLKGAAEICEGEFQMRSVPGQGTEVEAVFPIDHPDVPPLGNVKDTFLLLCVTNPEVRFSFRFSADGKDFEMDTKQVNDILGGLSISHPEVVTFLSNYLEEHL